MPKKEIKKVEKKPKDLTEEQKQGIAAIKAIMEEKKLKFNIDYQLQQSIKISPIE